jgi:hypothetical protein
LVANGFLPLCQTEMAPMADNEPSPEQIRYKARERWLSFLYIRRDLTAAQKLTGAAIVWHMNAGTGLICPGMATIAFETSQTERAVRSHVATLNRIGLLGVERHGRSYHYFLGFDTGTAVPVKPKATRGPKAIDSGTVVPVCNYEQRNGDACEQVSIAEPQRPDRGTAALVNSGTTVPPNLESKPNLTLEAEEAA